MQFHLERDDDPDVVKLLIDQCRQIRRRRNTQGAFTASRIELMFSKAIEDLEKPQPPEKVGESSESGE